MFVLLRISVRIVPGGNLRLQPHLCLLWRDKFDLFILCLVWLLRCWEVESCREPHCLYYVSEPVHLRHRVLFAGRRVGRVCGHLRHVHSLSRRPVL